MRVLVVEDEAMVAMLIEDMLLDSGYSDIEVCNRFGQAMTLIQSKPFDFVILDLNLEGELTYPIADILLERGTPFVFATGYGTSMLEGRYADVPSLPKPFRPEDIERVLSSISGDLGAKSTTS
ncbi:response regulator [Rhodoligotrophos ferricapiens]|uniref:response regulator n=1 Tax=Rhodoligotrophos ferricapiens TaxID=3069264 RepID=UPI00315D6913